MDKAEFIKQLRETAEVLKPLTETVTPGALTWDGTSYSKRETREAKLPDPYALAWWAQLIVIAGFIEAQDSPLSDKQIAFLRRQFFGGMGSLNDLSFSDPELNQRLNRQRSTLFSAFMA